jgi:AraC-like DNA-binding protein
MGIPLPKAARLISLLATGDSMIYLQQTPSPPLRSLVCSLWYCRAPHISHSRERVLPNGCMQIILNLSGDYLTDCGKDGTANLRLPRAIVSGAGARYGFLDTADMEELCGILIRPGGFARLFHERADLFSEQSIGLDTVWSDPTLIEKLSKSPAPAEKLKTLDALLTSLLHSQQQRHEIVDHSMHLLLQKSLSIAQCAHSIGISERYLSRVFREHVGLSPKLFCRIRRFQSATRSLHQGVEIPWAELALTCGYYDQSHFANDFRAFSGIDPTTYSRHPRLWQNHIAVP